MKDKSLQTTKVFPAAGASNSSTGIDVGARSGPGGIIPGTVELEIAWPALAALADTKTVTFTLQDSADNSSFTSIGRTSTITGAGGVGVAAGSVRFRLPKDCRRFINVLQAEAAAGGDITALSSTISIVVGEA